MKAETSYNINKISSDATNNKINDTRTTVKNAVLNCLESGRTLTSNDALLIFGTSRLSAVVHKLRNEGYVIRTEMLEVKSAEGKATEHTSHIASYSMAGVL